MIFANVSRPVGDNFYRAMQTAAGSLGIETTAIRIDSSADIEAGIDTFARQPNGGLVMAADPSLRHRALVIDLAARHQLPAIYPVREIVKEGGFAFYGIDFQDQYRGAATYTDRILRGTRPADLPIQAPTEFHLGINMKVANTLGLTIPPSLPPPAPTRSSNKRQESSCAGRHDHAT